MKKSNTEQENERLRQENEALKLAKREPSPSRVTPYVAGRSAFAMKPNVDMPKWDEDMDPD